MALAGNPPPASYSLAVRDGQGIAEALRSAEVVSSRIFLFLGL